MALISRTKPYQTHTERLASGLVAIQTQDAFWAKDPFRAVNDCWPLQKNFCLVTLGNVLLVIVFLYGKHHYIKVHSTNVIELQTFKSDISFFFFF